MCVRLYARVGNLRTWVKHLQDRIITLKWGGVYSAGFTYRLDRLKPRAIAFRGPPSKVCTISNTFIGRPHLCCHNVLYFLNNHISEYCRLLYTPHYIRLY